MNELYPLRFTPQFFIKPWGGNNLSKIDSLKNAPAEKCGEAWLLSGVERKQSVVSNGFLEGNELNELVEVYMEDLVGEPVFNEYGETFPILVKLLDTTEWLSVQVHPDNELAMKKHQVPFGKTEMWYILKATDDAGLINGFKTKTDSRQIQKAIENSTLTQKINMVKPAPKDVYFTPAGKIHAVGPGLTLAEIQQTSDFTYRLFDWGRTDKDGNARELHIENGLSALNYDDVSTGKTDPVRLGNTMDTLVNCSEFVTNRITLKAAQTVRREYITLDSFVILLCVEGNAVYEWENKEEPLRMGECILIPAIIDDLLISSKGGAEILEVFIQN